MAVNYTIFSDDTYRNAIIPDVVCGEWGLPLTQYDEETETEVPRTWTLEQVTDAGLNKAGRAFPVVEDENGVPDREVTAEQATDWVYPMGSTGRNIIEWIEDLAAIKQVDPNHCFLSICQTQRYLKNDGHPPSCYK